MPAWPPRPNLRLPKMLAGFRCFPQGKVPRTFFFIAVVVHACASLNPRQINLRKFPVVGKSRNPVINRTFAAVGERLLLQPFDQLHHVRNMIRCANPKFRRFHAYRFAIRKTNSSHGLVSVRAVSSSAAKCLGTRKCENSQCARSRILSARTYTFSLRPPVAERILLSFRLTCCAIAIREWPLVRLFRANEPQIVADPHKSPQSAARLVFSHIKDLRRASTGKRTG